MTACVCKDMFCSDSYCVLDQPYCMLTTVIICDCAVITAVSLQSTLPLRLCSAITANLPLIPVTYGEEQIHIPRHAHTVTCIFVLGRFCFTKLKGLSEKPVRSNVLSFHLFETHNDTKVFLLSGRILTKMKSFPSDVGNQTAFEREAAPVTSHPKQQKELPKKSQCNNGCPNPHLITTATNCYPSQRVVLTSAAFITSSCRLGSSFLMRCRSAQFCLC